MKTAKPGNDAYVAAGSLPKPGWLGRTVRIVLGALCLEGAFSIGMGFKGLRDTRGAPDSVSLWLFSASAVS